MNDPIRQLRHTLHTYPELSGEEHNTAKRIVRFFSPLSPDAILEELGGCGVALVFSGQAPGPTVMLRCELDAVPVQERSQLDYCSKINGVAHQCGHDGHMAIVAAVGMELAAKRTQHGRVVLLFQPAEENGMGAKAVLQDPRFEAIRPDVAFALHNLPGYPLGQIIVRPGTFNCASRGMSVKLSGSTAHAAQPETGQSPAAAMCTCIQKISALPPATVPADETAFATVVGAQLGKKAFGTAPGEAQIWTTLRSETDATMKKLTQYIEHIVHDAAAEDGLRVSIEYQDVFPATVNGAQAVKRTQEVVGDAPLTIPNKPLRWSEDFGRITATCEGALFAVGAGTDRPNLHNPDYDFPNALIQPAKNIFMRLISSYLD
ncbi:amidohydrolase [Desulfogranum marinum]|uniref:amidohydrolase n=1 Tax=Desulfogranum marinum TaxID=453220 RepID=UPI001963E19A|nr:amidohydrolase [Desulfogranum marinum]MBM9512775.1 amidohydrolase [Desulfogranum marinum]